MSVKVIIVEVAMIKLNKDALPVKRLWGSGELWENDATWAPVRRR